MGEASRSWRVAVTGLPPWLDAARLLGPGAWEFAPADEGGLLAQAQLERAQAADLAARLRGVGLEGRPLRVEVQPSLPRSVVRAARLEDARRRRDTTPGFLRAGARVDAQGRSYLTPEALALALGRRARGRPVIDAGCGVGGNTIGFARAGSEVWAIERDQARIALAAHNLRVYGVEEDVTLVHGDALAWIEAASAEHLAAAIVFCDPPWGEDWDRGGCTRADFPLWDALLARRGPDARPAFELWAKLPPSYRAGDHEGAAVEAWFGTQAGDRRRIKFVTVALPGPVLDPG